MSIEFVYLLYHVHPEDDVYEEDWKLIGVYDDEEKANVAIKKLRSKKGFCDFPDSFKVERYKLNREGWTEGYTRIRE